MKRACLSLGCIEMAFPSTEGLRQIPLNGHFLAGLANEDLKPKEILGSVYIPHSQKVRTRLVALKLFLPVIHSEVISAICRQVEGR